MSIQPAWQQTLDFFDRPLVVERGQDRVCRPKGFTVKSVREWFNVPRRKSKEGLLMAATPLTSQELDNIRNLAAHWGKIVARRAFGEGGPGLDVDFFTLEQVATAAASGLTEGTLTTLLELQAQALPPQVPCPDCGRLCPVGHEPRPLVSRGSTLTSREPLSHC